MPTDDVSAPIFAFSRIHVRRLYGVEHNVKAEDLTEGVNVIYGSNASGKTTLARAVRWMIWPGEAAAQRPIVSGRFRLGENTWRVDLDGSRSTYQKNREPASAPSVPPGSHHTRYHLYLPDLLAATDGADDFAQVILQEAQGGIDVDGAADALGFGVPTRRKGNTARTMEDARADVQEVTRQQEALREKEDSLDTLRADLHEADAAAIRARALEAAVEVAEARAKVQEAEAKRETFPDALEALSGDEAEQLDDLQHTLQNARNTVRETTAAIEEAESVLEASPLPDEGVSSKEMEEMRTLRANLREAETRLEEAKADLADARTREQKAWKRLEAGVDRERAAEIDLPAVKAVNQLARNVEEVAGAQRALETIDDLLDAEAPDPSVETLQNGLRTLHHWLQQPDPEAVETDDAGHLPTRIAGAAVAVAGGVVAVLGTGIVLWVGVLVVVLGVGVVGLDMVRARAAAEVDDGSGARAVYEREFPSALEAPTWTRDAVEEAATQLLQSLRTAAVDEMKRQERSRLKRARQDAADRHDALDAERQRLAEDLGVDVDLGSHSLAWLVNQLSAWQSARDDVAGAEAALESAEADLDEARDAINRTLTSAGGEAVETAAEASGVLTRLEEARDAFEAAVRKRETARNEKQRAEATRDEANAEIRALYRSAGLEDGGEETLRDLCAQYDDYKDAQEALSETKLLLQNEKKRLERMEGSTSDMENASIDELRRRLERARENAAERDAIQREIASIERDLEAAREGGTLEQVQAEYRAARDELARDRAHDYERAVGEAVASFVQEKTRDQGLPPVFERARELFAAITNHRYELALDRENATFRAVDRVEDRSFALDALSSGTKVQLLLSVRVAFVERQEDGCRLPLVLDETLANSDEEKAGAIIDAVRAVSASGRQVFYLTAQQDEVIKWRERLEPTDVPCRVVALTEAEPDAAAFRGDGAPDVPVPSVRVDAERLAGKRHDGLRDVLEVPTWTPRRPIEALHLWYLVEDPDGLAGLVTRGTERWGQLQFQYERAGDAATPFSPAQDARIRTRAKAVASWRDVWSIGRGRPLGRDGLEACDAITDTYLDRLTDLVEELNGDAEALLHELRTRNDPRTKRFQTSNADDFEAFCHAEGYIDARETVSPKAMWDYVTADLSRELQEGVIEREDLERLFGRLDADRTAPPSRGA